MTGKTGVTAQTERAIERSAEREAARPHEHPSLAEALLAFQCEMPKVAKTQTARIPGKNGASGYSYKYADLGDLTDVALPILNRHGLTFTCAPRVLDNGAFVLDGILLHVGGEEMRGSLPISGTAQQMGSAITYMRRYLFGAMTGIVTDDDEDGTIANQQAQTVAVPPHQERLQERIDGLDDSAKKAVLTKWAAAQLPALKNTTPSQAETAHGLINEVEAEAVAKDRLGANKVDDEPKGDG